MAVRLLTSLSLASSALAASQQLWFTSFAGPFSTFTFDATFLTNISTTLDAGFQPGWIAKHPHLDILYTPFRGQGGVNAWSYDAQGSVSKIATARTNGTDAVHCEVSGDGHTLAVPNINGANLAVFAVRPNGTFASSPTAVFTFPFYTPGPHRLQQKSRPHQARFDRSSSFLYVPNLGTDRLHVFRVDGPAELHQLADVVLPVGSGPRHMDFWPPTGRSQFLYLVNQFSNTVMVFDISTPTLGAAPRLVQTISTRGPGLPPSDPNIDINAAEVTVSPDGRFLIASNRNDTSRTDDTLASFSINTSSDSNHLTFHGLTGTGGKNPRSHRIDPTGRYIAIANQDTGINIIERDIETGLFNGVAASYTSNSPVSVLWRV
ncbi:lactonase, 7-bladed beta-propeller [Rhizoctonia solani]|uniref:Lactonase, 7-bladed beta-propeller n=1 Tax=Rhizoctonia solani TaxID=456999 RepID=A0A8H7LG42_9AGAM|nr:lactonase, 7-bladed beta-propeller [Rhizoctonia solani]KAF8669665.1 Lactonase, 7-bladed beta-propeller [Rhizoctonia solani]QRW19947.1 lactonase, 7-bladed beta-propeller [Rhizoctonia solani]